MTTPAASRVPLKAKVGYGIGMTGMWMPFMTVGFYLFYFYTDVFGLTPSQAGLIFFIATMWDAVTDPLMGWIAGQTKTRLGKYRPYILFGSVPMALAFIAVYNRPDFVAAHLFLYALITHLLFRTMFTLVYIPYTAMIARFSTNANERASIASVKTIFVAVGTMTVAFFGLPLVDQFGGGDDLQGFSRISLLFGSLSVVLLVVCALVTKEGQAEGVFRNDAINPIDGLLALFRNFEFVKVFLGLILFSGFYTILNKLTVYYFESNLGVRADARWALSAISLAGVLTPPLWAMVTSRTGKRFVWVTGCLVASTSLLTLFVTQPTETMVIAAAYFGVGIGIQAVLMTFYAMAADTIDYGEWRHGVRAEGFGFGVLSFANKTSLAIGGGVLGLYLSGIGYVPGESQSDDTLFGIRAGMTLIPATGFLISAAVISFFKLNAARHDAIIADLSAGRNAESENSAQSK